MPPSPSAKLIDDFRQTMVDCRQLYLSAARDCCDQSSESAQRSPRETMQLMDDLHRGLLIKVYMDVALADRRWQTAERELAQALFEHLWDRRLEGQALREAVEELYERSHRLSLRSVLKPFLEVGVLRERVGELETITMRLGNLVAKADDKLTPTESDRLKRIQASFDRMFAESAARTAPRSGENRSPYRTMEQIQHDGPNVPPAPDGPPELPQEVAAETLSPEARLNTALKKLDQLIGLPTIKREVQMLANFLKVQQQRRHEGLPETPLSLHMVFAGNPGTGKTTVARIVGQVYGAMGILAKGHLIETDRSGLVAEYAGQTATKTNQLIDQALDGVLFVDEAYSLVAESGEDAFGREALQTLLKRMEDDRERLVVILAGYPEPMERLLKSNPGLSSRFNRTLTFDDYECIELARIFEQLCMQNHYELSPDVRCQLLLGLKWLHDHRDEHFGNGRLIRNLFEDAIRRLAHRIVMVTPLTRELLTNFDVQDIVFSGVPREQLHPRNVGSTQFRTQCPGCQRKSVLTAELLGRRVRCPECERVYAIHWAEPVENPADPT